MNGKQRSSLRALANGLEPVLQIGKGGVTEAVIKQGSDALDARELIKVAVLKNCEYSAKELAEILRVSMRAEPVQCVGAKIVLYRRSYRKDIKHIEF